MTSARIAELEASYDAAYRAFMSAVQVQDETRQLARAARLHRNVLAAAVREARDALSEARRERDRK